MICHKSDSESKILCKNLLSQGNIVIIPTDTVYGVSGIVSDDKTFDKNVQKKIINVKGRDESKKMIQLISSPLDIYKYTNQKIPNSILSYWPGPLTIIVKSKENPSETIAFRCPGDDWLRDIIYLCNFPLYSTSANISGLPILETEKEIVNVFENLVDLIVLDGDKKNSLPSTIVKIDDEITVIREGALKIKL